jgi:hypothetical protein
MLVRLRWRRRDMEMCLDWMYMTDGMGSIGAFSSSSAAAAAFFFTLLLLGLVLEGG